MKRQTGGVPARMQSAGPLALGDRYLGRPIAL